MKPRLRRSSSPSKESWCRRTCPLCKISRSKQNFSYAGQISKKIYRISAHRLRYLRQRVVLTGLGSATFTSALEAAGEVYGCFDRQFSEGILESWTCSEEKSFGFPCLDVSNRYLTPAKEAKGQEVAFQKGVDPRGVLRGMVNSDGTCSYVHTEDNQVQYFMTCRDKNGSIK